MRKLVILSSQWPYGKGEVFLGNEVEYAHGFDEIYVLPLFSDKHSRLIPDNISLINCDLKNSFKSDCFKGIFHKAFWIELIQLIKLRKNFFRRLVSLIRYSGFSQRRIKQLRNWLEVNRSTDDEITIYTYWMASDAVAVALLKHRYEFKKLISRCHRFDLYEYANSECYLPYRKLIFQSFDLIVPISNDGLNYLIKKYPVLNKQKILVSKLGTIDHGINYSESIETKMPLSVVSCSNLIEVKRVDLMIKALMKVHHPVIWRHFGDGVLRDDLQKLTDLLPSHVQFIFMGSLLNEELMKWYSRNHVDVFVNTSKNEGLPVSIMEAMSFGIPVIATDVGGTSEIVIDNRTGFVLNEYFEPEQLSDLLDQFCDMDVTNITRLRNDARKLWEANHDAKKNYQEFYDEVLSEAKYE